MVGSDVDFGTQWGIGKFGAQDEPVLELEYSRLEILWLWVNFVSGLEHG
jgi:hypothetical protein